VKRLCILFHVILTPSCFRVKSCISLHAFLSWSKLLNASSFGGFFGLANNHFDGKILTINIFWCETNKFSPVQLQSSKPDKIYRNLVETLSKFGFHYAVFIWTVCDLEPIFFHPYKETFRSMEVCRTNYVKLVKRDWYFWNFVLISWLAFFISILKAL